MLSLRVTIIIYQFQNLSKTLVNIAYNINHSKELRDLFIDLVEKVMRIFVYKSERGVGCDEMLLLPPTNEVAGR